MPRPQTMATWKMPTCALVRTAAQTLPQPKKTSKNVPKNSPITHFGIGVLATSISAETWGGGSGRVALIVSLILIALVERRPPCRPKFHGRDGARPSNCFAHRIAAFESACRNRMTFQVLFASQIDWLRLQHNSGKHLIDYIPIEEYRFDMNVRELKTVLQANAEKRIRFILPDGDEIPAHFHITEVGYVTKRFVDCGGVTGETQICLLQTWVGDDTKHKLMAGRLAEILELGDRVLPHDRLEVEVEYDCCVI